MRPSTPNPANVAPLPVASTASSLQPAHSLRSTSFIGRQRELHDFQAALAAAIAGHGGTLLLAGEPGIGKTRLAEEAANLTEPQKMLVLWGRCWEGDGAPAFWPWVQIIRTYMQHCDPAVLASEMSSGAAAIAQVVPEVYTRLPNLSPLPELALDQARFRFFDSVSLFLKRAAAVRPLLLILDDLHWADAPSLLLLQFLAHEASNAPMLIVGAYRDTEVDREHPLSAALGVLARESQRILLSGFAQEEVAHFIQETTGVAPSPHLVSFVHEQTDGNPFFLSELVRLLDTEGRLAPSTNTEAFKQGRIPQGVRETIRLRLKRLSPICTPVLTIAAVIGRDFTFDLLAQVGQTWTGFTEETLLSAIQEAIAARILSEAAGENRRYRFTHALIRETLYDDALLQDRTQIHRCVGEAIETLYGAYLRPHLTALADHFFKARQSGVGDKALRYAIQAGERAAALLAYEEAVGYYTQALQLLAFTEANEKQRCELLLANGEVLSYAGETHRSRETFLQVAAIARKLRTRENTPQVVSFLARAALGLGTVWFVTGTGVVDEPLVSLLKEAREALGATESPLRAKVIARLAAELSWSSPRTQRAALSEEAVAMARRLGDDATLIYTLSAWHWTLWEPANVKERVTATSEIIRLAEKAENNIFALVGRTWRSIALLELGERRQSDEDITVVLRLAEKLRQPFYLWWAIGQRTLRALLEGRLNEAEQYIYQQFQLGQQVQAPDALQAFGIQMAILRNEQGRLQEMESAFKEFVDQYPTVPAWRCGLAGLYRELEQTAQARDVFEQIAAHDFTDFPEDQQWMTAMVLLSDVCAFLRDTHRAALLYTLLLPYANGIAIIGPGAACYGAVDRNLGLLAATQSRWQEAGTHFDDALAYNERIGAKLFLARTQYEYAQMLLARNQPEDRDRAMQLLDQALSTAQELGMIKLQDRVHSLKSKVQEEENQKAKIESPSALSLQSPVPSSQHSALGTRHSNVFHQEGEYWTVNYEGTVSHLRPTKGFHHLACLLREPGREFHVLDLLAMTEREEPTPRRAYNTEATSRLMLSDATPVPDQQARESYRQRLQNLRLELAEAEQGNDLGRIAALHAEEHFLTQELSAAYGVGHHARTSSGEIEKARKAVAYRIRAALEKIKKANPTLWRHLFITVKTGVFCSYNSEKPITWQL